MSQTPKKKKVRAVFHVALGAALMCSMLYVSYAMGFREGLKEDTVWLLPNC